jgi:hypothetical protein
MNEITITNYKERLSTEETKILIEDRKFLKKDYVLNALNQIELNSELSSQDNDKVASTNTITSNLLESSQQVEIDVLDGRLREPGMKSAHIILAKMV